jgi:uncharacterized protein (AIM24 family)
MLPRPIAAFLAAERSVAVTTTTQDSFLKGAFSGAGLFVLRAHGRGQLALAAFGAIHRYTLAVGQRR